MTLVITDSGNGLMLVWCQAITEPVLILCQYISIYTLPIRPQEQWNSNQNAKLLIQTETFDDVCKMAAMLFKHQCVSNCYVLSARSMELKYAIIKYSIYFSGMYHMIACCEKGKPFFQSLQLILLVLKLECIDY